jgi:dTDP-4-amino-4,6-dideoxygalactose transaminase
VKLKHLPDWIEKRRGIANLYHGVLSDLQELKLPLPPQSDNSFFDVYQNYVIRAKERDKLVAHLMETGIEILVSWPKPMHHHDAQGLRHFHLPKTEQISNEVLSLPMYPELSDEDVEHVVDIVNKFYKEMAD